jgi:membrane associated rhomboid family serine protease
VSELGVEAPVCYRHPDRVTYIRCARCERPICPDCMVSAAVGFQCPECVAEGRRQQPVPLTVAGGQLHARDSLVTISLIAVCVVVYILQITVPTFTYRFCLQGLAVADGQWYRMVTAGFLHASLIHIGFNMWALWVFGRPVERVLGRVRYLVLYLVCLLAGTTASYLLNSPVTVSLGASGAIFGLVGAMVVIGRRMHWDITWVIGFAVLNVALVLGLRTIDWHAHLGGLAAGAVLSAVYVYVRPSARTLASVLAPVVVTALLLGVVGWRTAQIRQDPAYPTELAQVGLIGQVPSTRPFP